MRNLLFSIVVIFVPIVALTLFLLGFYLEQLYVSFFGLVLAALILLARKYTKYYQLKL